MNGIELKQYAEKVLQMSIFSGDRAWAADVLAHETIALTDRVAEMDDRIKELEKAATDAAGFLRLNGLTATANTLMGIVKP